MIGRRYRRFALPICAVSVLGLFACVTQKKSEKKNEVEPEAILTLAYFDIAVCGAGGVPPSSPVTTDALTGYLYSLEPWVQECLVDGRNRKESSLTQVSVEAKVTDKGAQLRAIGDNLSPSGVTCIQKSLERLAKIPSLPAHTTPVVAKVSFTHDRERQPSLAPGGTEAVAFATRVRLSMPQWCVCFEPWKRHTPRALHADLDVRPQAPVPVDAQMELTNNSTADDISTCVKRKIEAMEVPASTPGPFKVSYPIYFIHSSVAETLMGSPPDIQIVQLDTVARRRRAEVSARVSRRNQAAAKHDAIAKKVKPGRKIAKSSELEEICAELVKADEAWVAATSQLLEIEEEAAAVTADLKNKDAKWADADRTAQATLASVQADWDKVRKQKAADEIACPQ